MRIQLQSLSYLLEKSVENVPTVAAEAHGSLLIQI